MIVDCHEAASRLLEWIESIGTTESSLGPGSPLKLFLTAVLCNDILRTGKPSSRLVEERAHACSLVSQDDLIASGSELVLLCCIAQHRQFGRIFSSYAAFLEEVTQVLGCLAPEKQREHLASYVLLCQLDSRLELPSPRDSPGLNLMSLLGGTRATTRKAVRYVEEMTAFGSRAYFDNRGTAIVFASILMKALREHDLLLGSALLRVLSYFEVREELAVKISRDFLLTNQDENGWYGLFPNETGRPRLADTEQRLEISLQCMWALSESGTRQYRMYRDLGRVNL
jgi:hypothetical protein